MTINRVVAIATAVLSLAVALLPAVADLDWTSTAGILGGLATVAAVALKWLDGWQAHEVQLRLEANEARWTVHDQGLPPTDGTSYVGGDH